MPRKGPAPKRPLIVDPVYGSPVVTQLVNKVLLDGKKSTAEAIVYGALEGARSDKPIIARVDGRRPPMKGDTVHFTPKAHHVYLFDAETGLRLEA